MTFIGGVSVIVILALLASGLVYDALAYVAALIIGELLCARYLAFRSPIRDMRVGTEGIELRFEGTRSPGPFLVPWSKIRPVRLDLSSKKRKFRPSLGEPPRSKYWLYFPDPRPPARCTARSGSLARPRGRFESTRRSAASTTMDIGPRSKATSRPRRAHCQAVALAPPSPVHHTSQAHGDSRNEATGPIADGISAPRKTDSRVPVPGTALGLGDLNPLGRCRRVIVRNCSYPEQGAGSRPEPRIRPAGR
jgi:hypothetical protein